MIGEKVIFDSNIILKILSYDARLQKLYFKFNDEISSATTQRFLEFDSKLIKKHFDNILFKYEIGDIIEDKNRKLLILDRFKCNKKKYYKVKCLICNYIDVVDEFCLKEHDYSCSCCYGKKVVVGVNDIATTTPWLVPYFQGGEEEAKLYTSGSSAELYFQCPHCNKINEKAIKISHLVALKKMNCICMDYISYPEKFMRNFLLDNNIDYLYQVGKSYFCWCKNYIYDFCILDKKIIIETHGEQHYKQSTGKFKITLEEQKNIDKEKQRLAENNGFTFIVVDCRKSDASYIYENIQNVGLISLLDINENLVNLKKLDQKSRNNILKEVCLDFSATNVLPKQLAEKYKLDITTIYKYLHIGNKIGWCNYCPKLNLIEGQKKTITYLTNQKRRMYGDILVFDSNNEKLIGKFKNQYDTSEKLKNIGIQISVSGVGQALKRENHRSKNLYFYYENEIINDKEGVVKNESSK